MSTRTPTNPTGRLTSGSRAREAGRDGVLLAPLPDRVREPNDTVIALELQR